MKHLLSILILLGFMSVASAEECSLQINYFGYGDGASEWRIGDTNKATGRLIKHTTNHPSKGEIVQRGIILDTPMCMFDVLNNQPHKPSFRKDSAYTHFIVPEFYDEEVCGGKIEKFYKDGTQVEVSVVDIWVGNANYATSFALIIDDIRFSSNEWLCSK